MNRKLSDEVLAKLSVVEIPNGVLGEIQQFKNFDPTRILHYKLVENRLLIYMKEIHRLEAMEEFKSTIEAFRYEVERGIRPEVEAFHSFKYDRDFTKLEFTVNQAELEQDITAEMIEMSIVEDALKYQIYSRKPIGVHVYYRDTDLNRIFKQQSYPKKN